jgi:hypothetical protein
MNLSLLWLVATTLSPSYFTSGRSVYRSCCVLEQDGSQEEEARELIAQLFSGLESAEYQAVLKKLKTNALGLKVVCDLIKQNDERKDALIGLLGAFGRGAKEATPILVGCIKNGGASTKVRAAITLGNLKASEHRTLIEEVLLDPLIPLGFRVDVVYAIEALEEGASVPSLEKLKAELQANKDREWSYHLKKVDAAIRRIQILTNDDPKARTVGLLKLLRDQHSNSEELEYRLWAAEKLAAFRTAEAVEDVRRLFSELPGDRGLSRLAKHRLVKCLLSFGQSLTEEERKFEPEE